MIKAAIFDMDGLMIDSEPLWARVYKSTFKEAFGIEVSYTDMLAIRGQRQDASVGYFYRKHDLKGRSQKETRLMIDVEMIRLIKSEGKFMPGVESTFEICQAAGLPMAIASSSSSKIIDAVVTKLQINHYFDHIYSAESEQYGKPHPGVFVSVGEHFGIDAQDCLVFEDSPSGVLAAKAAKMKCVAVPEKEHKHDKFIQAADVILGSLEEFDAKLLRSL